MTLVGRDSQATKRDRTRQDSSQGKQFSGDYTWALCLRDSHDKTFPAVPSFFVCDNLGFDSDVKLARKHTRHIVRDLPFITGRAIGHLMEKWHHQDTRIAAYKKAELDDIQAHDLVIRATDVGVCSNRLIPTVLGELRKPRHAVFESGMCGPCSTPSESLKDGSLAELPKRTEALHGLLDVHVGLN
ncbi:hypothetical protein DES53_102863 [Roseimicrobium gellanilyticum]|uniref:Uncharacterized protein n=1 Tax=Roseimicrobium gellanilyticum TaxID=748857 RepID=A0A366HS21_9BACT|nr:hypothetical protein [Roseimicrobium gellanilyticum]RBP46472.1 hypothetical protein DES53_102863 [Roseimicrobium gellanilyticum]